MSDYVIVSIRLVQELEMMSTLLCIISVAKGWTRGAFEAPLDRRKRKKSPVWIG